MDRLHIASVANVDRLPGFPRLSADSPLPILIVWLQANDPNGCYTAEEAALNGYNPLTVSTAWQLIADALDMP